VACATVDVEPLDPDLVEKAKAIKSEHKALGVVCFGYFRYRNARFGCAEVHQAIQCLGRAGMTQVRRIAQDEGFEMVHALTDCAFLQKKGVRRDEVVRLARRVTKETGVTMDVEGVYRWLVLLPSKTHSSASEVGVPNRYYGKFEDGTMKVRGIEVQRHITPPYLADVQQGMLDVFAEADDAAGFLARVPRSLAVAKEAARRIRLREVPVADLGLLVQATKTLEEYTVDTATTVALRALRDAGEDRRPGEYLKYVLTRREGPRGAKARPVELLREPSPWFGDPDPTYHVGAYLRLLARQVETLLSPFGYTEDGVLAWLEGRSRSPLRPPPRKPTTPYLPA
jgi:DNA polymerase II